MQIDPSFFDATLAPPIGRPAGKSVVTRSQWGSLHKLGNAGDVITAHAHAPGTNHLTAVMKGTVINRVFNADGTVTETTFDAPAVFVVPTNVAHEIIAVVDNSICLNINVKTVQGE
jgi:hypothetical protein